jgi:ABC-type multidrug transport system ATPase subunit
MLEHRAHISLTLVQMNSDMILVLGKGHLVEQSTCSELIGKNGWYNSLWDQKRRAEHLKKDLGSFSIDGIEFNDENEEEWRNMNAMEEMVKESVTLQNRLHQILRFLQRKPILQPSI